MEKALLCSEKKTKNIKIMSALSLKKKEKIKHTMMTHTQKIKVVMVMTTLLRKSSSSAQVIVR